MWLSSTVTVKENDMPLNRRDFINRSAATGAGVALAGSAG
ncbi:MAG: twin-arginine translocation signal domain-containing protein, partial [Streptomyces sp.]|nr:twin-arginine translocation signal domain-containing protein [Streptomyces sp.]